jgi:hypothetical protein
MLLLCGTHGKYEITGENLIHDIFLSLLLNNNITAGKIKRQKNRISAQSNLRIHLRRHTEEKPFACDSCDYRTSDHNSLRRHKMKHTGEKQYKCPHCSYTVSLGVCWCPDGYLYVNEKCERSVISGESPGIIHFAVKVIFNTPIHFAI